MEKPEWGSYIKDYVKRVKISMEMEKTPKDKVQQFKDGATALAHHIMRYYDEIIMFRGRSGDLIGGLGYLYFKPPPDPINDETPPKPILLFFLDGLTTGELILWTKNAAVTSINAQYLIQKKMIRHHNHSNKNLLIDEGDADNVHEDNNVEETTKDGTKCETMYPSNIGDDEGSYIVRKSKRRKGEHKKASQDEIHLLNKSSGDELSPHDKRTLSGSPNLNDTKTLNSSRRSH
jgi:hypothetical protein